MNRGEIWLVNFDPTVGTETKKTRPAIIISDPPFNRHRRTVVVEPLSTAHQKTEFPLLIAIGGSGAPCVAVVDQVKAAAKERFIRRLGTASANEMEQISDALAMHEIWWVRHAESAANASVATSGSAMIPLTQAGRRHTEIWARNCGRLPDRIVSSPYLRAVETATPLRELTPSISFETWPVQEFTFLDESRHRNTTTQQRRPFVDLYWSKCDPSLVDGAGAESFEQFVQRMIETLDRLRRIKTGLTIIFTHEHVMRAAAWLTTTRRREADQKAMRSYDAWRTTWSAPNLSILPMTLEASGLFRLQPLRLPDLSAGQ